MTEHHPRPGRRITMADVAREAGVSPTLVSFALRGAPGVSDQSRARILAVAQHLGYRPDARARALASLQSRVIGVVFGRAGRFHLELIDGLYTAAEERGWDLVLSALTPRRDEARAIESLQDFRFDALVMLGPEVAEPLLAGRVPLVVVGWHVAHPDVDCVRMDDDRVMQLAVQHLAELGHREITHLQGGPGTIATSRRDAYARAMAAAGLATHTRVVDCGGEDQLDGQRAARALLEDGRVPTAIIAFNDDIAAASVNVLAQQGIMVPRDVSVIGIDDSALARTPGVDLTSVRQTPAEMAHCAVDRIVARTSGTPVETRDIVLAPELVVRSSSGPAPDRAR